MTRPLRHLLRAGLLSGLIAAAVASTASLILQAATGTHYPELGLVSVSFAALVSNLVGSAVYGMIERRTSHPKRNFAILAITLATLDSVMVLANPPADGFATVATPLHYVVALVAMLVIPWLVSNRQAVSHRRHAVMS